MKGFFIVSENTENEKFDIKCELHPSIAIEEVPEEQQNLYIEVENANNIIKSLTNTKDAVKEKYFQKLLLLAQAGLVSEAAQPRLALKSLEMLKDEIVLIEGHRIKNDYMKKLGIGTMILSSIVIIAYSILSCFLNLASIKMYFVTWIGAMLGAWVSFGARKFSISYEQLSILEEDMMDVYIRLPYVGSCSIIFLLFLNSGIINIDIGKMSTINISNNMELQAIMGIVCGLVESKLGINIYNKAKTLIGENQT